MWSTDWTTARNHFCFLTDTITSCMQPCTVCPVNEYVGGIPEACQPCPAMSSSPGGLVQVCPCMDGTGRVNESDLSLPCVGELLGDILFACAVIPHDSVLALRLSFP